MKKIGIMINIFFILLFSFNTFAVFSIATDYRGYYVIYLNGDNTLCTQSNPCNFGTIYNLMQQYKNSYYLAPYNSTDYWTEDTTRINNFWNINNIGNVNISTITINSTDAIEGINSVQITTSGQAKIHLGNYTNYRVLDYARQSWGATDFNFSVKSNKNIRLNVSFVLISGDINPNTWRVEYTFKNSSFEIPADVWLNLSVSLAEIEKVLIEKSYSSTAPQAAYLPLQVRFYVNDSATIKFDRIFFYVPFKFEKLNENVYKTNAAFVYIGNANTTYFNSTDETVILSAFGNERGSIIFDTKAILNIGKKTGNLIYNGDTFIQATPYPVFYAYGTSKIYIYTPNFTIYDTKILVNQKTSCDLQVFLAPGVSACTNQTPCCRLGRAGFFILVKPTTAPTNAEISQLLIGQGAEGGNFYVNDFENSNASYNQITTLNCGEACFEAYGGKYSNLYALGADGSNVRQFMWHNGQGLLENIYVSSPTMIIRYYSDGATNITLKNIIGLESYSCGYVSTSYSVQRALDCPAGGAMPSDNRMWGGFQFFKYINNAKFKVIDILGNPISNASVIIKDRFGNPVATLLTNSSGQANIELLHHYMYVGNDSEKSYDFITSSVSGGSQNWVLVNDSSKFNVGDIVRLVCGNFSNYCFQNSGDMEIISIDGNNITLNQTIASAIGYTCGYNGWDTSTCKGMLRIRPASGYWDRRDFIYSPYSIQVKKDGYVGNVFNLDMSISQNILVTLQPIQGLIYSIYTYKDNSLISYFSTEDKVKIYVNSSTMAVPYISIFDPLDNNVVNNIQMTVENAAENFTICSYEYNFTNVTGWWRIQIKSLEDVKEKYVWVGEKWNSIWNDNHDLFYPFNIEINISEINNTKREYELVDIPFLFSPKARNTSIRITYFDGTKYIEIPSQLYNITQDNNGFITSANIVFLVTINNNTNQTYHIHWSRENIPNVNYTSDLILDNSTSNITIENSLFKILFENSSIVSNMYSKIGSKNFFGYNIMHTYPEIKKQGFDACNMLNITIINNSLITGPIFIDYLLYGKFNNCENFSFEIKYRIPAMSNNILYSEKIISNESTILEYYKDFNTYVKEQYFTYIKYKNSTNEYTKSLTVGNGEDIITYNLSYISFINENTRDAFLDVFLNPKQSIVNIYDEFLYENYERKIYQNKQINIGDTLTSNIFRSILDPLSLNIEETVNALLNPLNVTLGNLNSYSDSESPIFLDYNYTPIDVSDINNLTCYAYVQDNYGLEHAEIYDNETNSMAFIDLTNISKNLVGYWTFDENYGNYIYDISGNENIGSLVNNPYRVKGRLGNAIKFKGTNDYAFVNSNPSLNFAPNESFTISLWINASNIQQNDINAWDHVILSKGGYNWKKGYSIALIGGLSPARGKILFSALNGTPNIWSDGELQSSSLVNDSMWHHVVVIFDRDKKERSIYIDGIKENSSTISNTYVLTDFSNNEPLRFGTYNISISWEFFNGTIDDVRIFKRVLSEDEIKQLYNFRRLNAYANKTISADILEAGIKNCTFIVYDLLGNYNITSILINVIDKTPPYIRDITYIPDSENDLDPNINITIETNITDYTGIDKVILQYKAENETEWKNLTMLNDSYEIGKPIKFYNNVSLDFESNLHFRIYANDTLGNYNFSDEIIIPIFYDRTYIETIETNEENNVSRGFTLSNINIANVTINNTGDFDMPITFYVQSPFNFYCNDNPCVPTAPYTTSIPRGNSLKIIINVTMPAVGEYLIPLVLTTTHIPNQNIIKFTLISYAQGPYLYTKILTYPQFVTRGNEIFISSKIINYGSDNATDMTIRWVLPQGFTIINGEQEKYYGNLSNEIDNTIENNISLKIETNAKLGVNTIKIISSASNIQIPVEFSHSVDIFVNPLCINNSGVCEEGCSYLNDNDCKYQEQIPSGPASGPAQALSPAQKQKIFQTEEIYHITRGKEKNFTLKVENPFSYPLSIDSIKISGLLAQYLNIIPKTALINTNDYKNFTILITAPAYFTKGEHKLTFEISGSVKEPGNVTFRFSDTRYVTLIVHEYTREDA
ncbi:MAG: LamG-like jellyroll fold domain-containing protein, partial [Candidatus Aenigmatarchaeota archaeon]